MRQFLFSLFFLFSTSLVSQTPDLIKEVQDLILSSQKTFKYGDKKEAFQILETAKMKADSGIGRISEIYAQCLHTQVEFYIAIGDFKEAIPICSEARNIREMVLGKKHKDYVLSTSYLAMLYREIGDYKTSEILAIEVEKIRAIDPGKESREYGVTLNLLGVLNYKNGKYDQSEVCFLGAKDIFEKKIGKNSKEYSQVQGGLALLYLDWGKYDKAEDLLTAALEVQKKTLGMKSPTYASTLNTLASLYSRTARYRYAKQCYEEAGEIFESVYGTESDYYVATLGNLAMLHYLLGEYTEAESGYLKSLEIIKGVSGTESEYYTSILGNLGVFYTDIGQFNKAEDCYLKVKKTLEVLWKSEHPDYSMNLMNLGSLYHQMGRDSLAEEYLLDAKNRRKALLGDTSAGYAECLINLATVYSHTSRYNIAVQFLLEAKNVLRKTHGKEHPAYATVLQNLALAYSLMDDFKQAEPLFLEAKTIFEKTLGKEHPTYAGPFSGLSRLYRFTQQFDESTQCFAELSTNIRHQVETSVSFLSEKEMLDFIKTNQEDLDELYSLAQVHPSSELSSMSYDNTLLFKGYLLDNALRLNRFIANTKDSLTRDTFERWLGYKTILSKEMLEPLDKRTKVAELENLVNFYEKTLKRNPEFLKFLQVVHWKDVQIHLPNSAAAVEFIHYPYFNPDRTDSIMYAALVLLPNDSCPHFIPLCEQKKLEKILAEPYPDKRYQYSVDDRCLYNLIWRPIESLLQTIDTVYFASSGLLHTVNLDAIALDFRNDTTLLDRYKLIRLGSTRQLADTTKSFTFNDDALLFGGIEYGPAVRPAEKLGKGGNMGDKRHDSIEGGGGPSGNTAHFDPLKQTLAQVEKISGFMRKNGFNVQLFTSLKASEENFKAFADSMDVSHHSARVIHLATHGNFAPNPKNERKTDVGKAPIYTIREHPYLRSVLILADGNYAWQTGKPVKEGREDGILTAFEISGMWLPNTELVVLSACETGLGDLYDNEGVYGLQRAFKIAGVQYLIMSLWSVPEESTKELMTMFYQNWLEKGQDIPSAFRSAQLDMKKKDKDPDKWAGFILWR